MNWTPGGVLIALSGDHSTDCGPFACQHCGARFDLDRQVCPQCDGHCIERTEWPDLKK